MKPAERAGDALLPAPPLNEDSRSYWDFIAAGEWRMQKCGACGAFRFPPGVICRACASLDVTWEPVPSTGTVIALTEVHRAPNRHFADQVPYVLAIVELSAGLRLISRLTDSVTSTPVVGMSVELARNPTAEGLQLPVFTATEGTR